jgi:CRP-like cAMP-binding protein
MGRDWVPVLKELPLFEGMSSRHLRRIPARAKRYGAGETIVRAGDPGNAFYVVLDGTVRVDAWKGASVTLRAGDSFGEMSLLDGAPRSADITADGEVTLMVIGRAAFTKLLRSEPQMAAALLRTLAGRLRAAQEQY